MASRRLPHVQPHEQGRERDGDEEDQLVESSQAAQGNLAEAFSESYALAEIGIGCGLEPAWSSATERGSL